MEAQAGGRPILVLPEETIRRRGKDAQRTNIDAARIVSNAIQSTLGPKGMDKMVVDSLGDVTISNDGATILDEMEIEHPAAKMICEVAETQDDEVGDGTTTAVVIGGELLKGAEDLLDQDIHPSSIVAGYRMAAEKSREILEEISKKISLDEDEKLKKVAMTSMSGKGAEVASDRLADLAIRAVKHVAEKIEGEYRADLDNVKIEKQEGASLNDSFLVEGIIIDKERVSPQMPTRVDDAKIALINAPIEVKETETDSEIQVTDPEQLKTFMDEEESMLREMVEKIKEAGANTVICQKGIDDLAQHFLAREGIFAIRRAKKSDMERLSRATGGRIVTGIEDLTSKDLGEAKTVEERKISGEEMTFIEECKEPKAVSILIRGGTEHVVDEAERSLNDAINAVKGAIENEKVVAGGGAPEIEVARRLREYSEAIGGREALAVNSFADAVESIARTLAENAGLDPIDTLVELRSKHEEEGENMGIDVFKGEVVDMFDRGVIEPTNVKIQAISSGDEAGEMILRIDDVIAATKEEEPEAGGPGAPGEMPPGGMGY
ncbi:thermosome subunit [candidate division MSBL1 archaeon SCGC-AAA261O19]|uniref:Thermosome subunit n=3 Tax=candidate division MSBL1 TaxID=215777 RepID=A0A133V0S8_9EURY|nr:thermosome subunit [candidate division MSBL1 archaeon SCGC-AAA261C02]KXB04504.1 thermosome subunit [candidate division MSBL1 archaeon SCGC-AAA261O19]